MVFALSLFSVKKDYSRLFDLFNGDKPSIENPTNKPQTDGLPQSNSALEQENKVGGDTIEKKNENILEPSKESGKPEERE